jgi:benzil reductase ((S)-benzoin forming)
MRVLYFLTGSTRGLGAALAQAIAAGTDCTLVTLSRQPACHAARRHDFALDLADLDSVERWCTSDWQGHTGIPRHGRAVLINNAGIVDPVAPMINASRDAMRRAIAINVTAPMMLMQWFASQLAAFADTGSIINISSGAGRRPIAGWGAYCTTKAGLDMASQVAAIEWQPRIRVTSLAPGVIDTDMQAQIRATSEADFADVQRFKDLKTSGALVTAEAVAKRILELDSQGLLPAGLADIRSLSVKPSELP